MARQGVARDYLDRIRALPCLACGRSPSQAAHVRFSDGFVGKVNPGIGKKPHDKWTVPLCPECHRDQHKHGERDWWEAQRIDVIAVCQALWECKAERRAAMRKIGGLFVRGTGFSAEQIAGYNRDAKRLADWAAGKRSAKDEAAAIARAEAREKDFQGWDKKIIKRR